MSGDIKVAIIGCGHRGDAHAAAWKTEDRCRMVGLADIKPEAIAKLKAAREVDAGVAEYEDYRVMLEKEKPDIVSVCLWTGLHLPVIRDCLQADGVRAVFAEKPMAPTWAECREIGRLAEESGRQLTFCHQRRFASGNQLVRKWVAEGKFGEIKRMDLYSPRHLLDCGTHTFDQAMSFNGESPAKWVLGAVDTSETFAYFAVEAEIMATGTVVFENGVRATIQVGGPDMDMGSGVRLHGTDGFVEVDWDGNFRKGAVFSDPSWSPPVREKDGMNVQMARVVANVVDCLLSGEEPELSYPKALRAGEVIFAFYESVRRRARVELPLTGVDDNPLHDLLAKERGAA
jgi:Predicted dehydrogenases and related proteins